MFDLLILECFDLNSISKITKSSGKYCNKQNFHLNRHNVHVPKVIKSQYLINCEYENAVLSFP